MYLCSLRECTLSLLQVVHLFLMREQWWTIEWPNHITTTWPPSCLTIVQVLYISVRHPGPCSTQLVSTARDAIVKVSPGLVGRIPTHTQTL